MKAADGHACAFCYCSSSYYLRSRERELYGSGFSRAIAGFILCAGEHDFPHHKASRRERTLQDRLALCSAAESTNKRHQQKPFTLPFEYFLNYWSLCENIFLWYKQRPWIGWVFEQNKSTRFLPVTQTAINTSGTAYPTQQLTSHNGAHAAGLRRSVLC